MLHHQNPRPNMIVERSKFNSLYSIIAKVMDYINNGWPTKIEEQCKP